ncbi:major facilitator superfamily domain-containing protein 6-like [Condylostylus longicornis]|uniref:major facilitator superfamily domain-containing protein 6-like n=1 Tax=Condylostylus longicornis TaxID=2530218 RepID=UPI00244DFF6B|nr:major facilitator superfamily domain-containing protein 6-like [Condylostylus longicornis]
MLKFDIFAKINTKLLPMKAHYFLYNLATGPIIANLSIIARQKGFSSTIVGVLLTALYLVATIAKPVFGWLSDHFKIHKFIFILMQGITALTFFCVYFIPSFTNQVTVNSNENSTELYFCPKEPIWDNCLKERIEQYKIKIFKCNLYCKPEIWMKDKICQYSDDDINCHSKFKPFKHEIYLDMETIEKDSSCIIMKEFKNTLVLNNSMTTFYSDAALFAKFYEINCEATCEDDFLKGTLANKGTMSDDEILKQYQFWLFCGLLLIGYSSNSVVISMADTICFDLLGEDSHLYGRQRMWDAVGWGVAAVLIGTIIDGISGNSVFKDYTIVYFFCLVIILMNMLCSLKLEYTQPVKSKSILKDVGKLFKSAKIFTFFCWCCLAGFFSAVIWNFVFWHLEELSDQIGQNDCGSNYIKTLEGIDLLFQCLIGEIPFFFFAGYIIKKIGSINCMHITFAAFTIRFFYYSALLNPWWVLPIEALNGLTYGLLYATMTTYVNIIAPPGTEATLQGFVGALFEGVGISLGNFAAGTLFNIFGGHYAFLIFGITSASALAIHILVHMIFNWYEKNKKPSNEVIKP